MQTPMEIMEVLDAHPHLDSVWYLAAQRMLEIYACPCLEKVTRQERLDCYDLYPKRMECLWGASATSIQLLTRSHDQSMGLC